MMDTATPSATLARNAKPPVVPGEPIVTVRGATRLYGGIPAIENIDLTLIRGEVHCVLGENGAGKSTLAKSIAGVVQLTSGEMIIDGEKKMPSSPREALSMGIAMVFQETSLVPTTSVAQNLYLGQEKFFNRVRGVTIAAQQVLQYLNFRVDPSAQVSTLGAAKKQMVEIARAVLHNAKVIIFDEPTATLTPEEKEYFFRLVKSLKQRGVTIVFITHAVEDALSIGDRITVLRDARHVFTDDVEAVDLARVVKAMVGRDLSQTIYSQRKKTARLAGERVLAVHNLRVSSQAAAAQVKNSSFSVFAGQVTGFFGLVGAGRTETFKAVSGVLKRDIVHGGEVHLRGKPIRYYVPVSAVKDGIAYITEDRKAEGFFETMTPSRNIYMGLLAKLGRNRSWLQAKEEQQLGKTWRDLLNIRAGSNDVTVVELSGGNQQKVVIARSLAQDPELIIFDEPTRGVDVGAISEIHGLINRLADQGKAVVMISSYLPEVMALSDRILVARGGKVVEEFSAAEATEEKIMYAAVH